MRVAVISDIHANLHALEAVLADIDRAGAGRALVPRRRRRLRAAAERVRRPRPRARRRCALRQPRPRGDRHARHRRLQRRRGGSRALDAGACSAPTQRTWLRLAAARGDAAGAELFHGSPRDPVWDYVLSEEVALISLLETTAPLVLVGHSHVALALALGRRDDRAAGSPRPARSAELPDAALAPQPRLGRPAARRRPARRLAAD